MPVAVYLNTPFVQNWLIVGFVMFSFEEEISGGNILCRCHACIDVIQFVSYVVRAGDRREIAMEVCRMVLVLFRSMAAILLLLLLLVAVYFGAENHKLRPPVCSSSTEQSYRHARYR